VIAFGAQRKPPEIVASTKARGQFHPVFQSEEIPDAFRATMQRTTWHNGCPIPIADLRMLTLSYWSFEGMPQNGVLIVNKAVDKETRRIFRSLFRHGFMIERMEPIENFGGDDIRSMEANNTSSFNCRDITGVVGKFSNHSWGLAIDINPLTNPYVKGEKVLPAQGRAYLQRNRAYAGGVLKDSFIERMFRRKGWGWGGDWIDRQDYQHFEKPEKH
jgi:hypothetical protein